MSAEPSKGERLRRGLDWIEVNLEITRTPRHPEFPVSSWRVTADLPDFGDDDSEPVMETVFTMDG